MKLHSGHVGVIGGSSGIGLAAACLARDEGAQVILMLMTNDYMTGEVVHVDGGGRIV